MSARDGNLEVYAMNADGAGQTRLTNNTAADFQPGWGVATLTPAKMIEDLSKLVVSYKLPRGIETALRAKLNAARVDKRRPVAYMRVAVQV